MLNQNNLISVIINCHNGEKFLKECIESVISQTYKNWELIFWDNCSNDSSAKIFNDFEDSRFKYYYNETKVSLSKARNLAAEIATGEWIAFLDSDDYWYKDKLKNQINIIKNAIKEPSFVYSKSIIKNSSLKYNNSWSKNILNSSSSLSFKNMPQGKIFSKLLFENFIPLSTALISKKKYFSKGPINESLNQAEDYDLFLKLSIDEIVLYSDIPQTIYRIHDNNLSSNQLSLNFQEIYKILESYKGNPLYKKAISAHLGCEIYNLLRRNKYLEIYQIKKRGYSFFTLIMSVFHFIYFYLKIRLSKL
jgi:glycosyltransferase involved in cell wall biosynthesis